MRRFVCSLDASAGSHPIGTEGFVSGNLTVWFRGYIANSHGIEKNNFVDPCVTGEALTANRFAAAYAKWGEQLSRYVYGEYAIAIWDSVNRILLLSHDTLGIMHMYYRRTGATISFASHIDDLAHDLSSSCIDEEYIADYLCYGDHYGSKTPFTPFQRLKVGCAVRYGQCQLREYNCWSLGSIEPILYSDRREYGEHLRSLLKEAVQSALPTDGVVWCELSGGLDSSTVLATAAGIRSPQTLGAISYVYSKSKRADESSWSRMVAQHCGVTLHTIDADAEHPFKAMPSEFCGQPYHALINAALHRACQRMLVENKVDVLLTGMAGDAVLFGDGPEPFFLADWLCQGRVVSFARAIRKWVHESVQGRPIRYWMARCVLTPTFRRLRRQPIQDEPRTIKWLATNYTAGNSRNGRPRKSWVPCKTSVADSWYLERILRCANVVSLWDFQSSITAEFRHPLLYLPLVEFMRAVPWDVKFMPQSDRFLHRLAMGGILPRAVTERKTKGGPDQANYTGFAASPSWYTLLTGQIQLAARGYIDAARWAEAVALARVGQCDSIGHFKAAATLELWLSQLKNQRSGH